MKTISRVLIETAVMEQDRERKAALITLANCVQAGRKIPAWLDKML